jgi:hypothetical protein
MTAEASPPTTGSQSLAALPPSSIVYPCVMAAECPPWNNRLKGFLRENRVTMETVPISVNNILFKTGFWCPPFRSLAHQAPTGAHSGGFSESRRAERAPLDGALSKGTPERMQRARWALLAFCTVQLPSEGAGAAYEG